MEWHVSIQVSCIRNIRRIVVCLLNLVGLKLCEKFIIVCR